MFCEVTTPEAWPPAIGKDSVRMAKVIRKSAKRPVP